MADLALDTTDTPYTELAEAPPPPPDIPPSPPAMPGASRQGGYDPRQRPVAPPQLGPPAPPPPTRTVGDVDVNRLPFKPSVIDFNDDEEYMNGLRQDYDKVKKRPLNRDGSPVQEPSTPQQHPRWPEYEEAERRFEAAIREKKITNPAEAKALRQHLDKTRAQIEQETRAEGKKFRDQQQLEIRRNDQQRMLPVARARMLEALQPYVDSIVTETETELQTGDPETKRAAEYRKFVSPLTTMARPKKDGTMDYSLLRDTAASLMQLNPHINNPETAARAVLQMGTPIGFDDKTGKALPGANGLRGKGATSYQVLGHDRVNPQNVIIRTKDNVTLAVDPDTLRTIEKARMMGYGAITEWEKREAAKHGPTWLERALEPGVPKKGY